MEIRGQEFLHMVHQVSFRHHAEGEKERVNAERIHARRKNRGGAGQGQLLPLVCGYGSLLSFRSEKPQKIARQEDSHEKETDDKTSVQVDPEEHHGRDHVQIVPPILLMKDQDLIQEDDQEQGKGMGTGVPVDSRG